MKQQSKQKIIDDFHRLYYNSGSHKDGKTKWMGVDTLKCPLDLWLYQEIIFQNKPDLIIETGTCFGGTTLFLANMLDIIGNGMVISIDINPRANRPKSKRIKYLDGSSTKHHILKSIKAVAKSTDKIMVILDSNHSKRHVFKELIRYGKLVSLGQYLIVEDTNLSGHPINKINPGPMEAVEEFLNKDDTFKVDKSKGKYLVSFNPCGYLRKIKMSEFEANKKIK